MLVGDRAINPLLNNVYSFLFLLTLNFFLKFYIF